MKFNTKDMTITAVMAALICVAGPMSISIGPIPLSLASFAVYLAGAVLGGVSELRRQVKRKTEGIFEFLTDKPVAVTAGETYYITMKLRRGTDYPFDGAVESVAVSVMFASSSSGKVKAMLPSLRAA